MKTEYDVIVIGSGAGGLAAAVPLAQSGMRVLVCEQHEIPGGWTQTFTLNGYRFSPGVHYIGELAPGGSLRRIYEGLGRSKAWFFKWLKRYQSGDPKWYQSISRAPRHNPRKLGEIDRQRIIHVRKQLQQQAFAQVGVTAIKWELQKANLPIPSDRTINRILSQEGLVKKNSLYSEGG